MLQLFLARGDKKVAIKELSGYFGISRETKRALGVRITKEAFVHCALGFVGGVHG